MVLASVQSVFWIIGELSWQGSGSLKSPSRSGGSADGGYGLSDDEDKPFLDGVEEGGSTDGVVNEGLADGDDDLSSTMRAAASLSTPDIRSRTGVRRGGVPPSSSRASETESIMKHMLNEEAPPTSTASGTPSKHKELPFLVVSPTLIFAIGYICTSILASIGVAEVVTSISIRLHEALVPSETGGGL